MIYKNIKNIRFSFVFFFFFFVQNNISHASETTQKNDVQWTIIGAGPAGIIVVSLLLDLGIPPKSIAWVDPEFNVGRLGKYYTTVPGNSQTKVFIEFINSCKVFQCCNPSSICIINSYGPDDDYPLNIIVEPLQTITNYICTQVTTYTSELKSLEFNDESWHVGTTHELFTSHNVVLATGSHPKTLSYTSNQEIPLDLALDKNTLATLVTTEDSVAVVGGSHSAILILKYLTELNVKRIINFYKNPLCYSYEADGIYYNATDGLKGTAARWAQQVLEKNCPAHLMRIKNTPEALEAWLPVCNKIIYAIGYERNQLPTINGMPNTLYDAYNATSGVIGPRLFGIGIAFPEQFIDQTGTPQLGIGLIDFMQYAQCVLPEWMQTKQGLAQFAYFAQLFSIAQL